MNESFWEKQYLANADIVVIGAGIVGLQSAIRLRDKFPGRKIWVIDRAPFSMGASMRNAGFVCFGSMGEILDDISRTSEDEAFSLYQNRFKGVEKLLQEYGAEKIGYERTGGYEIFDTNSSDELNKIESNLELVNKALQSVTGTTTFQSKSSDSLKMNVLSKAIFTPVEGALQTHLLYRAIRNKALSKNIEIYTGVNVLSIEQKNERINTIITENGYQIHANIIVACTNAFSGELLSDAKVIPARGQVLVTSPIPDLAWRGLMHADKGYIYFRSLGSRILIGGARNADFEGETTTNIDSNPLIREKLVQFLSDVIVPNQSFEIEHEWSGIMGMHQNRTPVVEKVRNGLFACYRMGGMGVALSAVVSAQIADLIHADN